MGYKHRNKLDGDHFKWVINVGPSMMGTVSNGLFTIMHFFTAFTAYSRSDWHNRCM